MQHLLGVAFAFLLTACSLVALKAAGEEDGDALCLFQRDVTHSLPLSTKEATLAGPDPRPHWVLMPPGSDELKTQSVAVVPADEFGNPVKPTGPCEDPFCWGKERAARHLATDYFVQTKQKHLLAEYKKESEGLIVEAMRWRNKAMLAEVETRQLEAGMGPVKSALETLRADRSLDEGPGAEKMQSKGLAPAPQKKVEEDIMNLQQYTQKMQADIEQISQNKNRLEEQVKRMKETMARIAKHNEAMHKNFTLLSMDKIRLQEDLNSFKDFVKEELLESKYATGTTGHLSETSSHVKEKMMNLNAESKSCEKQLAELKQFIEEQLKFTTGAAAQKSYMQDPRAQSKSINEPFNANQHMPEAQTQISQKVDATNQNDVDFWEKTAKALMTKKLQLEETVGKLSHENKELYMKNNHLHHAMEQRK